VSVLHVQAHLDVHPLAEEAGKEQLGQHLQRRLGRQAASVLRLVLLQLLAALVVLDHTQPRMLAWSYIVRLKIKGIEWM